MMGHISYKLGCAVQVVILLNAVRLSVSRQVYEIRNQFEGYLYCADRVKSEEGIGHSCSKPGANLHLGNVCSRHC